ncbi:TIGR04211 family SH3 domain-containing protein [Desulfosarcina sp. OttesenSCG-928-G10]|nr:TIGR04211 family SH3 domain-containing protein [Desulfosarcina sp. OttesenSCG-928-G10]
MKHLNAGIGALLVLFLVFPAAVMAQTVYVTEKFEITMRTSPGPDRKIILLINSGTPLQILEKGGEWSRVKEPGGKEGWVLNRYLTPNRPCSTGFERLQRDYDTVVAGHNKLKEEFKQLGEQKKITDEALLQVRQEKSDMQVAHEQLQQGCEDYIQLQERHTALEKELADEKARSAQLDDENRQMRRDRTIQWVWTGGGILIIGFVVGRFSGGGRKGRSGYY